MSQDHDISQDFMEKSWEDMSVILDKEMPQKSKRRWLFFWMAIGIISIASSLFIINHVTEPKKKVEFVQLDDLKENTAPQISSEKVKAVEENTSENRQLVVDVVKQPEASIGTSTFTKTQSTTSTQIAEEVVFIEKEITENIVESTIEKSSEPSVVFISENASLTTNEPLKGENHIISTIAMNERSTSLPLVHLPLIASMPVATDQRDEVALNMTIHPFVTKQNTPKWSAAINAHSAHNTYDRFNGYGVGGEVSYHLARPFGLSAGLGVTRWNHVGSLSETATVLVESQGSDAGLNDPFEKSLISLSPISKWDGHGSLSIFFKPFRALCLYGGIRTRVEFLNRYQDENDFIQVPDELAGATDFEANEENIRREEIENPHINPFMGTSYILGKGFEIRGELEFIRNNNERNRASNSSQVPEPVFFIGSLVYRF